jgi:hypothetical protein
MGRNLVLPERGQGLELVLLGQWVLERGLGQGFLLEEQQPVLHL